MSRKRAGDETNRAPVAYVRNLSDEELADLLVSLHPKAYQDLLERALRLVIASPAAVTWPPTDIQFRPYTC